MSQEMLKIYILDMSLIFTYLCDDVFPPYDLGSRPEALC